MRKMILSKVALFLAGTFFSLMAAGQDPAAWWSFDQLNPHRVKDVPDAGTDLLEGYWENPAGVKGKCLKLDGYTTRMTREADAVPVLQDALSIECWIALQSLPWNWSAVVSQGLLPKAVTGAAAVSDGGSGKARTTTTDPVYPAVNAHGKGRPQARLPVSPGAGANEQSDLGLKDRIFLGVNAHGQPGFRLTLDGTTYACISEKKIPLLKWNHLAATYAPGSGMKIFLNGEEVAHREATGELSDDPSAAMLIGMNINRLGPEGSERQASAEIGSRMVLHGLLAE